MAVIMDPGLSLVLLIVLPVIAVIALLVAKKILPFFDKIQKKVDKLNLIIREKISGIRVIRASGIVGNVVKQVKKGLIWLRRLTQ